MVDAGLVVPGSVVVNEARPMLRIKFQRLQAQGRPASANNPRLTSSCMLSAISERPGQGYLPAPWANPSKRAPAIEISKVLDPAPRPNFQPGKRCLPNAGVTHPSTSLPPHAQTILALEKSRSPRQR